MLSEAQDTRRSLVPCVSCAFCNREQSTVAAERSPCAPCAVWIPSFPSPRVVANGCQWTVWEGSAAARGGGQSCGLLCGPPEGRGQRVFPGHCCDGSFPSAARGPAVSELWVGGCQWRENSLCMPAPTSVGPHLGPQIILQEKSYPSSGLCRNTPKLRDFCKVTHSQEWGKVEVWGYGELCDCL